MKYQNFSKLLKENIKRSIIEAEESDKYTHIGYGKYKEKGKEDDKDAQTFQKDDSGKFSPMGDKKGGEEVPDSQKLSGAGEFERPKDTKQDVDADMYAQDTWKRGGDSVKTSSYEDFSKLDYDELEQVDDKLNSMQNALDRRGEILGNILDPSDEHEEEFKRVQDEWDELENQRNSVRLAQSRVGKKPKDEEPPGKSSGIDDDPFDNLDNMFGDKDDDEEDKPWRYGPFDVVKDKSGEDMFVEPDKKPKKKRPGGKEAEAAYHKADMMMKKYAGVDIPKAEYWAKKKKKAADAMLPEHAFSEMFKRMENR